MTLPGMDNRGTRLLPSLVALLVLTPVVVLTLMVVRPASAWPALAEPALAEPVVARSVVAGLASAGAAAPSVAPAPAGPVFRWPLDGPPRPVRRFEPPPEPWLAGHRGVDLLAEPGALVRSAGGGVVHFAGWVAGRPVISVAHAGGLRTTYEPVRPSVRSGDPVAAGDPIGVLLAGHPGCLAGPAAEASACLHWGLRRGDEYLDPLALLGHGRVRLLPTARRRQLAAGRRPPAASSAGNRSASRSYSSGRL